MANEHDPGAHPHSLGELHDADLVSIVSDRLARTVVATFDIAHLRKFIEAPDELRFVFTFEEVTSVS